MRLGYISCCRRGNRRWPWYEGHICVAESTLNMMESEKNWLKADFMVKTRMHSSRMRTALGSRRSQAGFGSASVHAGIHNPPLVWATPPPAGVGLEIPPGQTPHFPSRCGPGDPPGYLQGILGYHLQSTTPSPTPVKRILDTRVWKYYLAPNFICGR